MAGLVQPLQKGWRSVPKWPAWRFNHLIWGRPECQPGVCYSLIAIEVNPIYIYMKDPLNLGLPKLYNWTKTRPCLLNWTWFDQSRFFLDPITFICYFVWSLLHGQVSALLVDVLRKEKDVSWIESYGNTRSYKLIRDQLQIRHQWSTSTKIYIYILIYIDIETNIYIYTLRMTWIHSSPNSWLDCVLWLCFGQIQFKNPGVENSNNS